MHNRKFIVFVIAVVAIMVLSFFGKEGSSAIVTLALGLFVSNVAQKGKYFQNKEE